jgi:hypothetical protein
MGLCYTLEGLERLPSRSKYSELRPGLSTLERLYL